MRKTFAVHPYLNVNVKDVQLSDATARNFVNMKNRYGLNLMNKEYSEEEIIFKIN